MEAPIISKKEAEPTPTATPTLPAAQVDDAKPAAPQPEEKKNEQTNNNNDEKNNNNNNNNDDDDDSNVHIIPWRAQLRKTNSKLNILD